MSTEVVISHFLSRQNRQWLAQMAPAEHPSKFNMALESAAKQYRYDMLGSDPIGGVSFQLDALNAEFIRNMKQEQPDLPTYYAVGDTGSARHPVDNRAANDILNSWQTASRRPAEMRDDQHGETGDRGAGRLQTAAPATIEYYDQSAIGQNWATEDFYARQIRHPFNANSRGYVGDDNPETNARLIAMRDRLPPGVKADYSEHGQITAPRVAPAEVRLHRRNIERDVRESIHGVERDCMIQRHDMTDLWRQVDHNQRYMNQLLR